MDDFPVDRKMSSAEFFFHQLVVQDNLPETVHLDHCYARLWNAHPDAAHARPAKMLFMKGIPHYPGQDTPSHKDSVVDVESVSVSQSPPYDGVRARALMNECERHVLMNYASDKSDDWEEHIKSYRSEWSANENRLFNKVMKVLQSDRLSRLAYEGTPNEPVNRRLVVNKTASNIRQIFSSVGWDMQQLHWLHQILLEHLSPSYLSAYLDVLQTLKSKVPSLIDKLVACTPNKTSQSSGEALQQLLKRPWDPVATLISQHKPKKLPGAPMLVLAPSGPQNSLLSHSRRMKFWHSHLSSLGRVVAVNGHIPAGATVGQSLQQIVNSVKNKVIELKVSFPNRPIILLGWTVGALIASQVALAEPVTAVICLGFPLTGVDGSRGNLDDPLLDTQTPTLFVVGQNANTCSVDDMEDFRERMRAESGLVVVGGADDQLRVSHTKKKLEGMTQMTVDRCILNEIVEYLKAVLTEPSLQLPPLMSDSTKVAPESQKKRKRKQKEAPSELPTKAPKKHSIGRKGGQSVNASPSSPGSSTTDTSSTSSSFGDASAKKIINRRRAQSTGETPKKRARIQADTEKQNVPKQPRQQGRQKKVAVSFSKTTSTEEPNVIDGSPPFGSNSETPKNSRTISLNIGSLSSLGQFKQAQALAATDDPSPTPEMSLPKTSTPNHSSFLGTTLVTKTFTCTPSKPIVTNTYSNESARKSQVIQVVTMPRVQQNRPQLQTLMLKGKSLVTSPARAVTPAAVVSNPQTMLLNTKNADNATYVIGGPKPMATSGGMLQSALLSNKPAVTARKLQVITFLKPATAGQEAVSKMGVSHFKKLAPKVIFPSCGENIVPHSGVEGTSVKLQTAAVVAGAKPMNRVVGKVASKPAETFTTSVFKEPIVAFVANTESKPNVAKVTVATASESKSPEENESGPSLDSTISDSLSHLSAGTQEAILALTQLSAGNYGTN